MNEKQFLEKLEKTPRNWEVTKQGNLRFPLVMGGELLPKKQPVATFDSDGDAIIDWGGWNVEDVYCVTSCPLTYFVEDNADEYRIAALKLGVSPRLMSLIVAAADNNFDPEHDDDDLPVPDDLDAWKKEARAMRQKLLKACGIKAKSGKKAKKK